MFNKLRDHVDQAMEWRTFPKTKETWEVTGKPPPFQVQTPQWPKLKDGKYEKGLSEEKKHGLYDSFLSFEDELNL